VQWLWPLLIHQELNEVKELFNNHPIHHNRNKLLPLGVSPNMAYATFKDYGAINCLQQVDIAVVHRLKESIGGENLVQFVSPEYAAWCRTVYETLGIQKVTLQNVWIIFSSMLLLM
jgi:hypothetical protein